MKLLVVNGNTSQEVTDTIVAEAERQASPNTEIVAVNGRFGAKVIGSRSENAIAEHAILDAVAENLDGVDAVLVAVSLDTAVPALREILTIPVVGMTEAALLTACMVGDRLGLLVFGRRTAPLYSALVTRYGLQHRLAGIRIIETPASSVLGQREAIEREVAGMASALAREEGVEVVIPLGAVAAGMPRRIQGQVPVPLVDSVACGVLQAESLVRLRPSKARLGSYALPDIGELKGISEKLHSLFRSAR